MLYQDVLVLGAHPDDEIGCAGTIKRLVGKRARVTLLTFSRCQDLNGPALITEWRKANNALGVSKLQLLDLPNRQLPNFRREVLGELDPHRGLHDLVLCPSTSDVHQDHNTVAQEARRAFKDTTVLGYELPLNHMNGSALHAFVRLEQGHLDAKLMHAKTFLTQSAEEYMAPDYLTGLARVRGIQSGTQYAEAFEVIRWVM